MPEAGRAGSHSVGRGAPKPITNYSTEQELSTRAPLAAPHQTETPLTPIPSKGRFENTSGSRAGEDEAWDKGTFSNEGVNLSLGSLQLHPSPATSSLCDAECTAGITTAHPTESVGMDQSQMPLQMGSGKFWG